MNVWTLGIVSGLYLMTAADYYIKGDKGMALAFVAYAPANVGFIAAAL